MKIQIISIRLDLPAPFEKSVIRLSSGRPRVTAMPYMADTVKATVIGTL